jgi:hypothetical protein
MGTCNTATNMVIRLSFGHYAVRATLPRSALKTFGPSTSILLYAQRVARSPSPIETPISLELGAFIVQVDRLIGWSLVAEVELAK